MARSKKVVLTVNKGIFDLRECPAGVDVFVHDYDVEGGCYDESELDVDAAGGKYHAIKFTG